MDDAIRQAIGRLKLDARSGASELLWQAIAILRGARGGRAPLDEVAREVARAQPSMAPIWNAALAAMADAGRAADPQSTVERRESGGTALDRFEQRCRRAGAALERVAVESLTPAAGRGVHAITFSFSGSVLACLLALAGRGRGASRASVPARVRVSCAEGRPAFEGRRMAEALAREGLAVDFFADAAVAVAMHGETRDERVVLVGADAVAPEWAVNKVGTGMLAAAAARLGVPVYVVATRDKFVDARVAELLGIADHDSAEVWDGPPGGVAVRNPYFERVGLDLACGILTDAGMLTAGMVGEACRAASSGVTDADIARLAPAVRRPSGP
jgi:translation initiation factor 2B subunit (eIF-2B alpha/beta/delta family)